MALLSFGIDLLLIGLLISGLFYAIRLTRQLTIMRESHAEMQQFVANFNATVARAEAGIRGLKTISRQTGDDLEALIENGQKIRDELHFLIESADQIATRLSDKAASATRSSRTSEEATPAPEQAAPTRRAKVQEQAAPAASNVERELLRALQKRD